MANTFNAFAALFALIAALMWLNASVTKVKFKRGENGEYLPGQDDVAVEDDPDTRVFATGREQSRRNAYAAVAAALASLFQFLGLLSGMLPGGR